MNLVILDDIFVDVCVRVNRMMNHPELYRSMLHCMVSSVQKEKGNIFVLWSGFVPNYLRMGPNIVLSFLVMEKMKQWFH